MKDKDAGDGVITCLLPRTIQAKPEKGARGVSSTVGVYITRSVLSAIVDNAVKRGISHLMVGGIVSGA
ncbi:hypothetical protein RIB2604_00101870 [Aspergillus luchuensis]|uniref:Uncharacterized protein n=1 Tax=Aspergillus kawachii TaxID=1069201 RepID=A0A146EY53_ASPKA|nr:hypothetical protein RIB2604_00101870 [Aspergillus luchuensis]